MKVLETERLVLRRLGLEDAAFILELLNDEAWLRFIGDKGVRNLEDARRYLTTGPMDMYERLGFGLWLVVRKSDSASIGVCGLIKRDGLEDADVGFAFLPAFRRSGYGREAASAVLAYGASAFGLERIVAITSPGNEASEGLLEALGFRFDRTVPLPPDGHEVRLFVPETAAAPARGAAWTDVPVFGAPVAGFDYRPRPGAYAAIFDERRRLAVVQTLKGYFLPGGGSEPGESPEETLRREVAEEIGYGVTDLERLGEAAEWVLSTIEDEPVRKLGVYFTAALGPRLAVQTESDHTLYWLAPEEAIARLSHESQAWVVERLARLTR